jgi:hypothetical protein
MNASFQVVRGVVDVDEESQTLDEGVRNCYESEEDEDMLEDLNAPGTSASSSSNPSRSARKRRHKEKQSTTAGPFLAKNRKNDDVIVIDDEDDDNDDDDHDTDNDDDNDGTFIPLKTRKTDGEKSGGKYFPSTKRKTSSKTTGRQSSVNCTKRVGDAGDSSTTNYKTKKQTPIRSHSNVGDNNTHEDRPATSNKRYGTADISLPVFTIHGNHDEPTGRRQLSVLDLLATSGLITYFGKTPPRPVLRVKPLLLQKGSTRLALYGIGYLRSNKLSNKFRKGRVVMEEPPDSFTASAGTDQTHSDCFKLLVLHQNRVH